MRKRDLRLVKHPGDRAILEELIKRGDALQGLHHVIVFFYLPKDDRRSPDLVLNLLSQRLRALGWETTGTDRGGLTADSHRMVDPDSVNAMTDTMVMLANELRVEFDGWECEVRAGES